MTTAVYDPAMASLQGRQVLLIIGGGIAAYKALELVRRLRERGAGVTAVMTEAARRFVTPLAVQALTGERVFGEFFDLDDENEIGHIRLSRQADLIVVAPATAGLLARMAQGMADDLAAAVLLATDRPVLVAPAMNPRMWAHPATKRNVARLAEDGIAFVGPEDGEMAERGEAGTGRLADPMAIVAAIERLLGSGGGPLAGLRAVVTSGPTREPIDPVRYIANRSSGRQGHAIAAALAAAGAEVTLVSGPVEIAAPAGVTNVAVETAREMQQAVEAALPCDIAVMAAAVADWRVEQPATEKIKKPAEDTVSLLLVENPDILAGLSKDGRRPALVVGFAAETENLVGNAVAKLRRKGCDWIVANDVSPETGIMGGARNRVHLITVAGVEDWPEMSKAEVARALVARIVAHRDAATAALPAATAPDAPPSAPPEPDPARRHPAEAAVRRPAGGASETLPLSQAALDIRPTR